MPTLVPITRKLQELLLNNEQIFLPTAPELTQKELGWRSKAACKGMDTNIFFPERGENLKVKKAKEVCSRCPVQRECLDYSLQFSENGIVGIWGGMAGKDRRELTHQKPERPVLYEAYR